MILCAPCGLKKLEGESIERTDAANFIITGQHAAKNNFENRNSPATLAAGLL
jgi:hypothetical protein